MEYALTPADVQNVNNLNAEQRYEYLLNAVVDLEQIWILSDGEGFSALDAGDERCIPIWPHAELAQLWVNGELAGFTPTAIDLSTFLDKWIPGLEGDELMIAVFPHPTQDGIVLEPVDLRDALEEAMQDDNAH
ncbi:MAG TPA: DUF2750 domain-containing protein [Rheinheimera sp.]|nr:DUF2750 domain-containing protein [Rheinheimera sp.]